MGFSWSISRAVGLMKCGHSLDNEHLNHTNFEPGRFNMQMRHYRLRIYNILLWILKYFEWVGWRRFILQYETAL